MRLWCGRMSGRSSGSTWSRPHSTRPAAASSRPRCSRCPKPAAAPGHSAGSLPGMSPCPPARETSDASPANTHGPNVAPGHSRTWCCPRSTFRCGSSRNSSTPSTRRRPSACATRRLARQRPFAGPRPVQRSAAMTRSAAVPAGTRLVFGASGYIGSNLVPALVAAGHRVRATARNVEVLEARGWDGVDLVPADALDTDPLRDALAGVDTAYYLVHSMAAGRDFAAIDRQAAGNFARAAANAGVRRIVYLGGLIPPNPRSEHLRSRAETGEVLRRFPVPVTEIRAGMIIGPGSAAYEVIRDLVNHLPAMVTPRWVKSVSTPIALEDLLSDLVEVADCAAAAGRTLDVGGP